jgi:hypothetical protein
MKRKFIRVSIVLLLLLLPFMVWRAWLNYAVKTLLADIHAAGLPMNGVELNDWYPAVPDNENAALVLTQVFTLLKTINTHSDERAAEVWKLKDNFPRRAEQLTGEQVELIRWHVETNGPALAKADEALKLPASRYPVDFTRLVNTELPHLAHLANLAYLNQCAATLAVLDGRNGAASAAIATTLAVARTLDNEPCLISQLVRLRCVKQAITTFEIRVNAGVLSPMEITNLFGAFAEVAITNTVARALVGERAMFASFFSLSKQEAAPIFPPHQDAEVEARSKETFPRHRAVTLRAIGYYDLDLRHFLGAMATNILFARRPPPYCLSAVGYSARASEEAKKRNHLVTGAVSSFGSAVVKEVEAVAYQRMALTCLQIEKFRNASGHLPEELDELDSDFFLSDTTDDPFTGLELNYRRTEVGYVIYSVGRDREDNGGLDEANKKESVDQQSYDLTFVVAR